MRSNRNGGGETIHSHNIISISRYLVLHLHSGPAREMDLPLWKIDSAVASRLSNSSVLSHELCTLCWNPFASLVLLKFCGV